MPKFEQYEFTIEPPVTDRTKKVELINTFCNATFMFSDYKSILISPNVIQNKNLVRQIGEHNISLKRCDFKQACRALSKTDNQQLNENQHFVNMLNILLFKEFYRALHNF